MKKTRKKIKLFSSICFLSPVSTCDSILPSPSKNIFFLLIWKLEIFFLPIYNFRPFSLPLLLSWKCIYPFANFYIYFIFLCTVPSRFPTGNSWISNSILSSLKKFLICDSNLSYPYYWQVFLSFGYQFRNYDKKSRWFEVNDLKEI